MGIIYCLTFPSGKKYVGQTRKPLEKRVLQHRSPYSKCILVRNAIKKYETFTANVLIEVEDFELDKYERFYIKELKTLSPDGYNLTTGGEGCIPSEETRQKMRESRAKRIYTPEMCKAISNGLKGHIHSEETKRKISETHKTLEKTISPENREKINESIRSNESRKKHARSKRKYDKDLPIYIHTRNHKTDPGYSVNIPGEKPKYFCQRNLSMEEKKQLAIDYHKDYYKNKEAKFND